MEYSRCPNISQAEYDKAWKYVSMIDEAVENLRGMGMDELADRMEDCEIYQKNKARKDYNIRKEKKDKVPENRVPCERCNTMVLKRGMKEHMGNKKCQAIQAENRQCAVVITRTIHQKVLVAGKSDDPFAYRPDEKGVVVPVGMDVKDWQFSTTEIGDKRKKEYDAYRKARKAELKAIEEAKVVPIVAETADIPEKKTIKIKTKPVKKKLNIVE